MFNRQELHLSAVIVHAELQFIDNDMSLDTNIVAHRFGGAGRCMSLNTEVYHVAILVMDRHIVLTAQAAIATAIRIAPIALLLHSARIRLIAHDVKLVNHQAGRLFLGVAFD